MGKGEVSGDDRKMSVGEQGKLCIDIRQNQENTSAGLAIAVLVALKEGRVGPKNASQIKEIADAKLTYLTDPNSGVYRDVHNPMAGVETVYDGLMQAAEMVTRLPEITEKGGKCPGALKQYDKYLHDPGALATIKTALEHAAEPLNPNKPSSPAVAANPAPSASYRPGTMAPR